MLRFTAILALGLLAACTPAEPPRPAGTLKLATWNMEWLSERCACLPEGGAKLCEMRDGSFQRAQDVAGMRALADQLDADIISFQEVDGPDMAAKVFDPGKYEIVMTDEEDVQRPGFAIRKGIPFRHEADLVELDDKPAAKGCGNRSLRRGAVVTVDTAGGPVTMLAVHLKSGCFSAKEDASSNTRTMGACEDSRRQQDVLARWVEQQVDQGRPFIVAGDFNRRLDLPGDRIWEALTAASANKISKARELVVSSCNPKYPEFIDHIVMSADLGGRIVAGSHDVLEMSAEQLESMSDHCPVSVSIRPAGQSEGR
ncbi:MAG TPA: endonuclease/exonuclease/phosphatase family protein [Azospirillaceae bacterium]|nr:endonuclease/exonuclease/phosphatase family protein [Azospirillaceae bacterium]